MSVYKLVIWFGKSDAERITSIFLYRYCYTNLWHVSWHLYIYPKEDVWNKFSDYELRERMSILQIKTTASHDIKNKKK